MQMRQKWNDADNAQIFANICKYMRICTSIRYLLHNCVKNAFQWNVITKEIQIRASYWAGQILEKGETIAQQQLHSYLQGLPHLNQKPVSVDRTVDFLWNQNHGFPLSSSSAPTIVPSRSTLMYHVTLFLNLNLKHYIWILTWSSQKSKFQCRDHQVKLGNYLTKQVM